MAGEHLAGDAGAVHQKIIWCLQALPALGLSGLFPWDTAPVAVNNDRIRSRVWMPGSTLANPASRQKTAAHVV